MNRTEIENILETCELFKGLEKSHIEKIADLCTEKQYEGGEYAF